MGTDLILWAMGTDLILESEWREIQLFFRHATH